MSEKKVNIPGNFGYGDMPADYRKRYKQMIEQHNNKKKDDKKETAMERISRILYGGNK